MPSESRAFDGRMACAPTATTVARSSQIYRAVPQASSLAICAAILPHVQRLAAGSEWRQAEPPHRGINVDGGALVHPALKGMI